MPATERGRAPRSMPHCLLCSSTRCTCLDSSIRGLGCGPASHGWAEMAMPQPCECLQHRAQERVSRCPRASSRCPHPCNACRAPALPPSCSLPTTLLLPLGRPLSPWGTHTLPAFFLASDPVISRSFSFLGLGPQGTFWGLGVIGEGVGGCLWALGRGGSRPCRAGVMVRGCGLSLRQCVLLQGTGCGQGCIVLGESPHSPLASAGECIWS